MRPKAIFITGPTASGKSALAVYLAKKINGEVINADSRQVYRGLDVGSAKITLAEMRGAPHHLLSIASPKRDFSLARWLGAVETAVRGIIERQQVPIFCGGTVLYLRALSEGWVLPTVKPNAKLRRQLERCSVKELQRRLERLDPERARTIEAQNPRRLIRAIEIATTLGRVPLLRREPKFTLLTLAPQLPASVLERRLAKRLRLRFHLILTEIKQLRRLGLSCDRIKNFGLEYDWFGRAVCDRLSTEEAITGCLEESIKFAKKQQRSLEQLPRVRWLRDRGEAVDYARAFLHL